MFRGTKPDPSAKKVSNMKIKKNILLIAGLLVFVVSSSLLLMALQTVAAQPVAVAAPNASNDNRRIAAIFVENRVGPALNDKVAVLEDFLTSRITEKGFSVISREVSINALKTYSSVEISAASATAVTAKVETPAGSKEAAAEVGKATAAQVSVTPGTTSLDRATSDSSSALRLAQNLGADYLLVASITSFGSEKKTDAELKTVNVIYTLRVSYKVLEAAQGGSLIADTVKAVKTIRSTESNQTENSDIINELLDDAATQVAENAGRKQPTIAKPSSPPKQVEIAVSCGMQDLVQMPISIPDVRVLDDGTLYISTNHLGIQVLDATVEIDGFAIGSAPGKFRVRLGPSKMRITREGFTPWERQVNCNEGQKFKVALQMSEAGYDRWMKSTTFLFGLKTAEKLTDGTVKMMEGFAQTLKQSGYRVDTKTDVKANIEAKGKSLFDGAQFNTSLFGKDKDKDK